MKILIAGKIEGEPIKECYQKFIQAKQLLQEKHGAFNRFEPEDEIIEIVILIELKDLRFGMTHTERMQVYTKEIAAYTPEDAVYLLKDWEYSVESIEIHKQAEKLNLKIHFE